MKRALLPCLVAAAGIFGVPAHAQTYPAKAIRMVVHFPPGGPTDLVARMIGQKLTCGPHASVSF